MRVVILYRMDPVICCDSVTSILTNAQIMANGTNFAFLNSNFVEFATSTIGDGGPINGGGSNDDGYWLANSINSATALGIQHTQIYYWLFNSPTAATASEYGIFTAPSNTAWIFPAETDVPNTTITDLSEVPHNTSGILFGSYGTGLSRDGESPLYNLAEVTAVPEPASVAAAVLATGAVAFGAVRRRFKK
jgi:hypothetical protein